MKRILPASVLLVAIFGFYLFLDEIVDRNRENTYCGKVVQIYITPAGYKVSASRHVVFYCDSIKRNIDVRVTNQCYVNTTVGEHVCYELNKMQLEE